MLRGFIAMSYRKLDVWNKSIELVIAVYQLTKSLPPEEKFGLASQIQRSAVSVSANIAEGYGRSTRGEYLQFLSMANGSLKETETLLTILVKVDLVSREQAFDAWKLAQTAGKMLTRLILSLKQPKPIK